MDVNDSSCTCLDSVSEEKLDIYYFLQDKTSGEFLGIDTNSGGYPFLTRNMRYAKRFLSMKEVELVLRGGYLCCNYVETFPELCGNLEIKESSEVLVSP